MGKQEAFFPDEPDLFIVMLIGRIGRQPCLYPADLVRLRFPEQLFDQQAFERIILMLIHGDRFSGLKNRV